jgi:ribonuclease T2
MQHLGNGDCSRRGILLGCRIERGGNAVIRKIVFLCALALLMSGNAMAKSKHGKPKAQTQAQAQAKDEAGHFDYYVLTLSWSPAYCATHPKDKQQCGVEKHGFVLHGLWPQYAAGGYPQTCKTDVVLDENAREFGASLYPNEMLVAHEWTKHGTCSGLDAMSYFGLSERARNSVTVPDKLQPGNRVIKLPAKEISRLIRDANPGLNNNMLTVNCAGPELSEVRVCLSPELEPQPCGTGVRSSCGAGPIRVRGVQ